MDFPRNILPPDTPPEVWRVYFQRLREMTPQERLAQAFRLTERARRLTEAGVRSRHPDYDNATVRLAVIRITVGDELFRKFFPGVDVKP